MNIIIIGHTGMLGKALIKHWKNKHKLYGISRKETHCEHIKTYDWGHLKRLLQQENIDVVVNLCGETIGQPWHHWPRKRIYDSRITTTKYITSQLKNLPIHLLNASGVGVYPCTEQLNDVHYSEKTSINRTSHFLQSLAYDWEQAALTHDNTTLLRTAVVMKKNDGVLQKLMMGHQLKLLTQLGQGNNPFPWIAIDDWCRAVDFIVDKKIKGPINLTSPDTSSYNDIMNILCKSLNAYKFTMPNILVKSLLGEMGTALFLTGSAAIPSELENLGFKFKHRHFSELEI